jgi:drug/metabolite transporter (DMT)-like permease
MGRQPLSPPPPPLSSPLSPPVSSPHERPKAVPLVLILAIAGISFAGPLTRLSHAEPLAIAIGRLAFSLLMIGTILAVNGQWRQWKTLSRGDLLSAVAAGVFLAVHFWSWISSIGMTSVAASVVLVNLSPVIVAGGSALWLGERPSYRQGMGIAIALLGAIVLASADFQGGAGTSAVSSSRALIGDLLAVVGAITVSVYLLAGRRVRQKLDLWPYVGLVYGVCFVVVLAIALARGTPIVPQPPRELLLFAALAIGPMMLGHTGFNWALRYLPAYVVSLVALCEPVGATILAALLPGIAEHPGPLTLLGGAIVLGGVVLTTSKRS